jgi:hypothetical protein
MVDATGSLALERELVALGRVGVTAAMLVASVLSAQREADAGFSPATRAENGWQRPRHVRSRGQAREIVASTI